MDRKDRILEPFDFEKSPSMSSQMFEAAPGVFGDKDGVGPLQSINRVMIGGPVDIFDFIGRAGESGLRGAAEVAGGTYEALGGGQGMSRRLTRDIYGLGQIGGLMAGASPSSLSSARVPSTRRAAPSDSTPSEGIMMALEGPPKPAGLLPSPMPKKALEGEIVSGPSDVFLQAQAKRDKAISNQGREVYQEEMDYLGLEDSFQTIKNDIDEGFEGAADRGFEPMDVDGFFDTFQDSVMYERMKAENRGEKPNMGEIIAKELPEAIASFERSFGLFVDSDDLVNKISKTADDTYGFGVKNAKKRMDEAEANRRSLETQRNIARANREQREYYRSMGITDDMTDEQVRDMLYERQMGAQRELAGAGIPEAKPEGPNLRVVIDNDDIQKKNLDPDSIDYKSLEVDGIDYRDAPEFVDAYFSDGYHVDGSPLEDWELEELSNDYDLVHQYVINKIY